MSRILITGASGFLAGAFARELAARDHVVVGVARRPQPLPHFARMHLGVLGRGLDRVFEVESIDAVIHCACDLDDLAVNTAGTVLWAEQAAAAGVSRQLFIGSLSGIADAETAYGRHKFETAAWFTAHGHPVLALGLVLGRGGLFGRLVALMTRFPAVPLIGGGWHRASVVDRRTAVDAACALVRGAFEAPPARSYTVHEPERYTMRDLMTAARRQLGLRTRFVPVPMAVARGAVTVLGALGLSLGVRRENLDGLEQNDRIEIATDVRRFRDGSLSLAELMARAELTERAPRGDDAGTS